MFSKVTVAAAATVAFFLASPVSAFPAGCTRNYTVVSGDICDGISKANNVSTYQLAVVNRDTVDSTCSNLMPGQVLCLGTTGEDCTTTYAIANGDTCGSIQSQFGVNSTILEQNNPQINEECTNIYPGEVLCVAPTVLAPPVPAGFFDPATNSNTGNTGSVDTNDDEEIDWIPVTPEDEGYSEDLPYCE